MLDALRIFTKLLARIVGAVRQHALQRRVNEIDVGAMQRIQDHVFGVAVEQGLAVDAGLDIE
eukprot:4579154-Pleurochrysis_carterae.AAC.1